MNAKAGHTVICRHALGRLSASAKEMICYSHVDRFVYLRTDWETMMGWRRGYLIHFTGGYRVQE
jgi:hypothetical protein